MPTDNIRTVSTMLYTAFLQGWITNSLWHANHYTHESNNSNQSTTENQNKGQVIYNFKILAISDATGFLFVANQNVIHEGEEHGLSRQGKAVEECMCSAKWVAKKQNKR